MKLAEIREKSAQDLRELDTELQRELFELRMQHYTGQLDKPAKIRVTRKNIARVKTVIGELQRQAAAAGEVQ